ncbi:MAG: DivIVA domain-containing protein [Clostridia bacterium]|nr:DivIVA domain-containing protein [Clostridia bacterium]
MAKLFRGALFGYNKKDVQKYVEEISVNFNEQLNSYKAEIERLNGQKAELDAKRTEIESKKAAISDAIISAQEQGERIIADARIKAEELYKESQQKVADENQKLVKIRREIINIRRNAIKTLNNLNIDSDESENTDEK